MDENHATLRVWKVTRQKLKVLAAMRGERMVSVLDALVDEALKQDPDAQAAAAAAVKMMARSDKGGES